MALRLKHGMGDWFDPSCEPGTPGCVPHAYCYIPFMATPDCLQSFAQGVQAIGGAVGNTVGSTVSSTITGAVEGVLNPSGDSSSNPLSGVPSWMTIAAVAVVGVVAVSFLGGGSPRRYGR